jgi:hypothetical protein
MGYPMQGLPLSSGATTASCKNQEVIGLQRLRQLANDISPLGDLYVPDTVPS